MACEDSTSGRSQPRGGIRQACNHWSTAPWVAFLNMPESPTASRSHGSDEGDFARAPKNLRCDFARRFSAFSSGSSNLREGYSGSKNISVSTRLDGCSAPPRLVVELVAVPWLSSFCIVKTFPPKAASWSQICSRNVAPRCPLIFPARAGPLCPGAHPVQVASTVQMVKNPSGPRPSLVR